MENDVKRRRCACTNACTNAHVRIVDVHVRTHRGAFAVYRNLFSALRKDRKFRNHFLWILIWSQTLFPRVMLCGNSYEHPYAMTSISAPALVAAHGLVGVRSDACSLFDSRRFSPNTSSVQTCRNRRTFVTCARTHTSSCPHGSERQPTCAYRTGEQFSENCESSVQKIFLDFR